MALVEPSSGEWPFMGVAVDAAPESIMFPMLFIKFIKRPMGAIVLRAAPLVRFACGRVDLCWTHGRTKETDHLKREGTGR